MNREIVELREVITKLVPMLTGKGLRVTQRGSQAYVMANTKTNKPEVVNIPSIPDNASSEFISAISGFIDHEVGHVLFTDWKFYGGDGIRVDKFSTEGQALTNSHNIVEDTFIEREIVKTFPGSKFNFAQLHEHFIEKITKKALEQVKGDAKKEFSVLFVPMVRALSGQKVFQDFMDAGDHWSHPAVKNIHMALSDETLELIKNARNTKETLKAAQEIHDILFRRKKDEEKQPEPEQPQQQPKKGKSQDKPEKKAEAGDGDGERDHSESEPGDQSETDGDDEGQSGNGSEPDNAGQQTEESDDGGDDAAGTAGGKESDGADGKKARSSGAKPDAASNDDSEDDAQDGGDDEGNADDDGEDADGAEAGDDPDEEGEDGGDGAGEGEDGEENADESDGSGEDDDADEAGEGVSGSADDEDDGEDLSEGQAEEEEILGDIEGGGSSGQDDDEQSSGGGYGGDAGKSMFELDASEFDPVDLSSAIAKEISELASHALNDAEYSVYTRDEDKIDVFDPDKIGINVKDEWVPKMEEAVQGMVGKMQKDIERMMAAQSFVIRTPGHTRGRLHAPSLYRVIQNDPRVFTQKEEIRSKDTAVMLLIDNSGSMHGYPIMVAMQSAYALASTLERVNIPNEVMGFTTGHLSRAAITQFRADPHAYRFSRKCTIVMPVFKSFNERVTPAVKRRIASQINAQVGMETNVDGESLEYAAISLMRRPEKRKVMLVMSDGMPVGTGTSRHLKTTVEKLTKMGIETVGMGINTTAVKQFYPRSMVLNNVEELPSVVMCELRRILSS